MQRLPSYTRFCLAFLAALILSASALVACNIPVFRYALERWKPDECEMIVFADGGLPAELERQLSQSGFVMPSGGGTNRGTGVIRVSVYDTMAHNAGKQGFAADRWSKLSGKVAPELPFAIVRAPTRRGPVEVWSGELTPRSIATLRKSPARTQLSERLLSGNSIVWLLLEGTDKDKTTKLQSQLLAQSKTLARTLQLPEGIGLPGSELFSDLPLWIKFTVIKIDRDDPQEAFLVNLFRGLQPKAFDEGSDMLVPVFGRGRALEVIPVDELNENLVEDIGRFLCAACSCQVKDQNPGFDLLLDVDWNTELFGEEGLLPPAAASQPGGLGPAQSKRLAIPSGIASEDK